MRLVRKYLGVETGIVSIVTSTHTHFAPHACNQFCKLAAVITNIYLDSTVTLFMQEFEQAKTKMRRNNV